MDAIIQDILYAIQSRVGRKGGRQGICGGLHRLRQGSYTVTGHFSQGQTDDHVLIHVDTELGGQRPAQQPHGLRCCFARRIRRANLHQRPREAGSGAGA
jgi:hypothetical protein